jgi:hypothetical protein
MRNTVVTEDRPATFVETHSRPAVLLRRYPDWHARLERFLSAQKGRKFQYGAFDCCLFVCGALEAMTGVNPAEGFIGRYSTRRQARALLRLTGGIPAIAEEYGLVEIPVRKAKRGDVLQMGGQTLGLMSLNGRDALVLATRGLMGVPGKWAARAWTLHAAETPVRLQNQKSFA